MRNEGSRDGGNFFAAKVCSHISHSSHSWRNLSERIFYILGSTAGLPDGKFSNQKSQLWLHFGGH
jgi:hypothetical protein